MPNQAWVEQKRRTGKVITDYLAAQIAGRYLKQAIESGYDNGREMYTMTVDEVLAHADAVVKEAGGTDNLPSLPVINENIPTGARLRPPARGQRRPGATAARTRRALERGNRTKDLVQCVTNETNEKGPGRLRGLSRGHLSNIWSRSNRTAGRRSGLSSLRWNRLDQRPGTAANYLVSDSMSMTKRYLTSDFSTRS